MSEVVDSIVTEYELDPRKFVAGMRKVIRELEKAERAEKQAHTASGRFAGAKSKIYKGLDEAVSGANAAMGLIAPISAAATAGVVGLAAAGAKVFTDYAGFESLVKALEAIEGSSAAAADAMKDLQGIAAQPGLGFEESVRGYAGLRRTGLSKEESKRTVAEAGNANAYSGGSTETFGQILLALQQIAVKPFLQGDELLQLMEAGIAAPAMLKNRFGTGDGEELKKMGITSQMALAGLVDEMAKLPRVAGGAQNTLDNLFDTIHFASVNAGEGLLEASGGLEDISTSVAKFTDAGIWAAATSSLADSLGLTSLNAQGASDGLLDLTAMLMTMGDVAGNVVNNVKDVAGFFGNIWNWLTTPIGGPLPKDGTEEVDLSPSAMFDRHRAELEGKLQLSEQSKKKAEEKAKKDAAAKGAPGTPAPAIAAPATTPLLERIAKNTDPLQEIANNILGGGTLGRRGVSRQELADVKSGRPGGGRGGRGGGGQVEQLIRQIADLLEGTIVEAHGMTPRRAV